MQFDNVISHPINAYFSFKSQFLFHFFSFKLYYSQDDVFSLSLSNPPTIKTDFLFHVIPTIHLFINIFDSFYIFILFQHFKLIFKVIPNLISYSPPPKIIIFLFHKIPQIM